jgi:hypothetical protein
MNPPFSWLKNMWPPTVSTSPPLLLNYDQSLNSQIHASYWMTFPLTIVNFNHFFIQPAQWRNGHRGPGALRQSATFGPPLLHFGDLPPRHTPIFPKYEKNFPETPKNFPDIWYFSTKLKHFSRNPRNVLSNFLWSFLSGAPKVQGPPVTGHPDTLPLRHWTGPRIPAISPFCRYPSTFWSAFTS